MKVIRTKGTEFFSRLFRENYSVPVVRRRLSDNLQPLWGRNGFDGDM